LTEKALPYAKRDLGKIGITKMEQLDRPLPARLLTEVKVVVRTDDDGVERNRVDGDEQRKRSRPESTWRAGGLAQSG